MGNGLTGRASSHGCGDDNRGGGNFGLCGGRRGGSRPAGWAKRDRAWAVGNNTWVLWDVRGTDANKVREGNLDVNVLTPGLNARDDIGYEGVVLTETIAVAVVHAGGQLKPCVQALRHNAWTS